MRSTLPVRFLYGFPALIKSIPMRYKNSQRIIRPQPPYELQQRYLPVFLCRCEPFINSRHIFLPKKKEAEPKPDPPIQPVPKAEGI